MDSGHAVNRFVKVTSSESRVCNTKSIFRKIKFHQIKKIQRLLLQKSNVLALTLANWNFEFQLTRKNPYLGNSLEKTSECPQNSIEKYFG